MTDKYTALWLSHSSISAFLECPRSYFLKNVYKDPKTGHKVKLISPPLALGQAVHEVVESLSELKTDLRFKKPLMEKFEEAWKKISVIWYRCRDICLQLLSCAPRCPQSDQRMGLRLQ